MTELASHNRRIGAFDMSRNPPSHDTMPQYSQSNTSQSFVPTAPDQAQSYYQSYVGPNGMQSTSSNGRSSSSEPVCNSPNYHFLPQYAHYASQPDTYMRSMENLDPHSGGAVMGNSLSPSTINDHFSPDPFLSDTSLNDLSTYSTPGLEDAFLETQFTPILNIGDANRQASAHFGSFQSRGEQLNNYGNHLSTSTSYPCSANMTTANLPSPQSTHRSSPVVPQNFGHSQPGVSSMSTTQQETPFAAPSLQHMAMGMNRQQPSPALTSSSVAVSSSDVSSQPQLVVTSADDYQGSSDLTRSFSKRSHGSRKAKTHLTPWTNDSDFSEDEGEGKLQISTAQEISSAQSQADGPWLSAGGTGRSGVQPEQRTSMNADDMPTLEELEEQRLVDEKNAEVAEWLEHSDVGSGAEDIEGNSMAGRKKKLKARPRARSTNDAAFGNSNAGLGVSNPVFDESLVPGPGLYLNVPSEMGDNEDSDSEDEPGSPVAIIPGFRNDNSYFPTAHIGPSPARVPATGDIARASPPAESVQGITANLAIMRFRQRARETDNASLTATVGSRRRSESDIASVFSSAGISKLLLSPDAQTERKSVRRRGSFLENILPNRNNSNKMKRKGNQPPESTNATPVQKEAVMSAPKRIGSFGRTQSPRVDTNLSSHSLEPRSPSAVGAAASGAIAHAKQIWRSRSRSDLGKPPKSLGLAELWTQSGGPPMPTLASPLNNRSPPQPLSGHGDDDSGDEEVTSADGIAMDLSVRTDMRVIPTYDGFKYQARDLNPRLTDFLLERVTQEQVKRYRRLVDMKLKHSQSVTSNSCASKSFCFASGGESRPLPPRAGGKDPDATLVGFQILSPGMVEDDLDIANEGQTVAAQFPSGVPLPPVKHLPAEFECPLCFKVKKFYKPSDWTKHVHEDVQPFTCTFLGCNEPKSFKRKADWVRHENERHRQLESWTCNIGECSHTCYRKDNFVQHLVREHKVPEPKVRTGRAGGSRSPATPMDAGQSWQTHLGFPHSGDESMDDVWALVDKCHKDATKQPKDEPCKFCGNMCTSWKKLTVHLAKHMEQISMPVLSLIEPKRMGADQSTSGQLMQPMSTLPRNDLPIFLCDEPIDMDMETPGINVNGVASSVMHSYPPTMAALQAQYTSHASNYSSPPESYGGSFPPALIPARSRAASFNESLSATRQGTTYPPMGLNTQYDNNQVFYSQSPGFGPIDGMSNTYLTPASGPSTGVKYSSESNRPNYQQTYGCQG